MKIDVSVSRTTGKELLVHCTKCGPFIVDDGDPYTVGVEHLQTHGCVTFTLNRPPA